MTEHNHNADQPDNSVSGYYEGYSDTQKEVLANEMRRTRNTLFTIAAIIFVSDIISLMMADLLEVNTILASLIVPAILVGLGFLAIKEPLTAIIIAAVIIIGIWVYAIVATEGRAALMGWLIKAVIIYFLIAGFQHAREAMRIKKELRV